MATPKDWRIVDNGEDWMRHHEKRIMHEERRPRISKASDLLGPGFGPYATIIDDWNGESARFGGFFYSEPGAINSPDGTKTWLGMVIAIREGHGFQQVWSHTVGDSAESHMYRTFHSHDVGATSFGTWRS